ncbi:hypothetical protein SAMN05216599_11428 [Pseudomonas cichorii]|nr:hypothetical protein SAMN05216599_11428 [Pseudomonas cichorii]
MRPIKAEVTKQLTILNDRTAFQRDDLNGLTRPKNSTCLHTAGKYFQAPVEFFK